MPILRVVIGPKFKGSIKLLYKICEGVIMKLTSNIQTTPRKHLRLIKSEKELSLGVDITFEVIPLAVAPNDEHDIILRIIELMRQNLIREMPYLSFGYFQGLA